MKSIFNEALFYFFASCEEKWGISFFDLFLLLFLFVVKRKKDVDRLFCCVGKNCFWGWNSQKLAFDGSSWMPAMALKHLLFWKWINISASIDRMLHNLVKVNNLFLMYGFPLWFELQLILDNKRGTFQLDAFHWNQLSKQFFSLAANVSNWKARTFVSQVGQDRTKLLWMSFYSFPIPKKRSYLFLNYVHHRA